MGKLSKYIVLVISLIAIVVGYFYFFQYNKAHVDYAEMEADIVIPSPELFREFTTETEEATKKYTGKVIQTDGMINGLEEANGIMTIVFVFNEGDFGDEGVRCVMKTSENPKLEGLTENIPVIIKGHCTGYNQTDVLLEDCIIIN